MRAVTITRIAPAAIAAIVLAGLTACAGTDDAATSDPSEPSGGPTTLDESYMPYASDALITPGELKVCTNPPYEPFELEDNGKITGFDIDLAGLVAAQLGPDVTVVPVSTPFETIESGAALDTNACDLLASGITIKPERSEKFDFSDPYFDVNLGVLTKDPSITDEASLKDKIISAQISTTGLDWSKAQGLSVKEFKDLGLQVQALQTGDADASVGDVAVLAPYATGEFKIAFEIPTGDQFGLGVRKGNSALLNAANDALAKAKSDGTYATMYQNWIGVPYTGTTAN